MFDLEQPRFQGMPVFAAQTYGRGRTFAMATDSTVAWGTDFEKSWGEGDNRYFRKFWRNVVRWLAEGSAGSNRRLRVESDKVVAAIAKALLIPSAESAATTLSQGLLVRPRFVARSYGIN